MPTGRSVIGQPGVSSSLAVRRVVGTRLGTLGTKSFFSPERKPFPGKFVCKGGREIRDYKVKLKLHVGLRSLRLVCWGLKSN